MDILAGLAALAAVGYCASKLMDHYDRDERWWITPLIFCGACAVAVWL